MSAGTAMICQPRKHQTQNVQEFGPRAEGTAYAGNAGTLMQCQRGRNIQNVIHLRLGRSGHFAAGISGKCFQIPPGAFRIQHSQRQRRFSGTGHSGNSDNFIQRDVHIDIFQIVYPRSTDFYSINHNSVNHPFF